MNVLFNLYAWIEQQFQVYLNLRVFLIIILIRNPGRLAATLWKLMGIH